MEVKKADQKREIITVKLHHEPELKDPYLAAAWSGMGNVAFGVAKYLRDKLGAELFGEIDLTQNEDLLRLLQFWFNGKGDILYSPYQEKNE